MRTVLYAFLKQLERVERTARPPDFFLGLMIC
jgi:hypothetical protein